MKYIFIVILAFYSGICSAQWYQVNGMEGAHVSDVVVYDSSIFTTGSWFNWSFGSIGGYGVMKRNLTEPEWSNPLPGNYFAEFTMMDTNLYINGGSQLFKADSHGDEWEVIYETKTLGKLAVIDSFFFYTGETINEGPGLYKSFDQGLSFTKILDGDENEIMQVLSSGGQLYYHEMFNDLLMHSSNGGKTWDTLPYQGFPYFNNFLDIYYDAAGPLTWAATQEGIYTLGPGADYWVLQTDGMCEDEPFMMDFEIINNVLHSSGNCGVYYYDTATESWVGVGVGLEELDATRLSYFGDYIYCGTNRGIYKKHIDSTEWQFFHQGQNNLNVTTMFEAVGMIWATDLTDVYKSEDYGGTFEKVSTEPVASIYDFFTSNGKYYITATYDGAFVSEDGCMTWEAMNDGLQDVFITSLAFGPRDILCLNYWGVKRFDTTLNRWFPHQDPMLQDDLLDLVSMDSIIFFTTESQELYRSYDDLHTYHELENVFQGAGQLRLEVNGGQLFVYDDNYVWASDDYGESWISMTVPYSGNILSMDHRYGNYVFGCQSYDYYEQEIYYTEDQGATWKNIGEELPESVFAGFEAVEITDGRVLAAVRDYGLWYRDDLLVGLNSGNSDHTDNVFMYPNPANEYIIVKQESADYAVITISNSLGQQLISREFKDEKLKIYLNGLPSGIYILLIKSGDDIQQERIIKK